MRTHTEDAAVQHVIEGAGVLRPSDHDARPETVLASFARFAEIAQDELAHQVAAAHSFGMTWAEIGDVLGTTRQAAWERFH